MKNLFCMLFLVLVFSAHAANPSYSAFDTNTFSVTNGAGIAVKNSPRLGGNLAGNFLTNGSVFTALSFNNVASFNGTVFALTDSFAIDNSGEGDLMNGFGDIFWRGGGRFMSNNASTDPENPGYSSLHFYEGELFVSNNFVFGNASMMSNFNASKLIGTAPLSVLPSAVVTNGMSGVSLASPTSAGTMQFTTNTTSVPVNHAANFGGGKATNISELWFISDYNYKDTGGGVNLNKGTSRVFGGSSTAFVISSSTSFTVESATTAVRDLKATNITAVALSVTNGVYFHSNSITVAAVSGGMTNGASWLGMMSNALQVAWMSNNIVTWKILAP